MKETIKQGAVFKKKVAEVFINGEDTVAVLHIYELKGHRGGAVHGIFIAAGRTETAMTAERNKFKLSTMRTAIHGTAERRITTMDHLIDIFHLRISGMKSIFNLFIIVCKNFL